MGTDSTLALDAYGCISTDLRMIVQIFTTRGSTNKACLMKKTVGLSLSLHFSFPSSSLLTLRLLPSPFACFARPCAPSLRLASCAPRTCASTLCNIIYYIYYPTIYIHIYIYPRLCVCDCPKRESYIGSHPHHAGEGATGAIRCVIALLSLLPCFC